MKKILKIAFIVIGAALVALSGFLILNQGPSADKAVAVTSSLSEAAPGDAVVLRGKVAWDAPAKDAEFGLSADSPVFVRKVEMVQWYKNLNDEVYMTLWEEKLPDFEADGKSYKNPEFPTDIVGKKNVSSVTVGGIPVGEEVALALLGGGDAVLSSAAKTVKVNDLSVETGDSFGLSTYEGFYATPGEEWQPGDICVSFYYLDGASLGDVTVYGVSDGSKVIFGEKGKLWDKNVTNQEIDAVIRTDNTRPAVVCGAAGILLLALAFLLFRSKKK